eukprot:gnl/Chilomastix_caulleri/1641.p1 GENE.gnl/Chilomastix_caulleri/1641~~gnl/Chilomastix_caulleri/1641.p1  ORF type:complete len:105 (-),score=11.39 gnl/Chilomastix_caulleri/1641:51-365(-)
MKETTKLKVSDSPFDLKLLVETRKVVEIGREKDKPDSYIGEQLGNMGRQGSDNMIDISTFIKYPVVFTICSKIPNIKDEASLNKFCCILSDAIQAVRGILNRCM